VLDRGIAACAEFPNDNPALHEGAIWSCAGVTAPVTCEVRAGEVRAMPDVAEAVAVVAEGPTEPTPPVCVVEDDPAATDGAFVEDEDDGGGFEIVAELPPEDVVYESVPPVDPAPAAADDPYVALMRVLEQVAVEAGAPEAVVVTLWTVLGQVRIEAGAPEEHQRMRAEALAWQGILRGESEDFGACGMSMLDEWSALLVATLLGTPGRADMLKRELRRRGVAAFGLVDLAA
jgi:hypothetical protein